jgi:hypothetical protein
MIAFFERIAVEVVVTVCVGAVVGLMSGRWSMTDKAVPQNPRRACPHCGTVAVTDTSPNRGDASGGD